MPLRAPAIAVLCLAACAAAPSAHANPDSLIEEATSYTVKLRVSVRYPFFGETNGTFSGAGFVVDRERGWIATNSHVAKRSPSRIQVVFKDRAPVPGRKIYVDSHLDIAIVEVPPAAVPEWGRQATLGCGEEPAPGQQVVAFGHPHGLDFTATRGIVAGSRYLDDFESIQTDAAINPGNSGGALIDERTRRVVGINKSNYGNNRGTIGIAIPITLACRIVELMRAGKDPAPPQLPARFATTTMDRELYVASAESPWDGQLRSGDRIVAIAGDRRRTYVSRLLDRARGAEAIELTVRRDGEERTVSLPVPTERSRVDTEGIIVGGALLGRSPFPESERDAVHVHYVEEASAAELASFWKADQVVSVDGVRVTEPGEVRDLLAARGDGPVSFVVRRRKSAENSTYRYLMIKMAARELETVSLEGAAKASARAGGSEVPAASRR